jgi:RHS repeat-associated protein
LTNGTAVTCTVIATNAIGNSAASAASNSVTPATVPGAPTIGTATPGDASASVTFTAPAANGGSTITSYTATSSPGGVSGSCTVPCASINVTGLTNGTAYTFTIAASNAIGAGAASAPSNSVVPNVAPAFYYVHPDHLGTPRAITRASDNGKVWEWSNTEPFGNNPPTENPGGFGAFKYNNRFPGQYFDQETDTYYNYYRDYDPSTGRYIQSDPIGLGGGINTYLYANANPLLFIDPTGENPIAIAIAVALKIAVEAVKKCAGNAKCRCTAYYAAYKSMCEIGCRGTDCITVTLQARAANLCHSLRALYVNAGCDAVFPTRRDHPAAVAQALRAAQNCENKRQRVCCGKP